MPPSEARDRIAFLLAEARDRCLSLSWDVQYGLVVAALSQPNVFVLCRRQAETAVCGDMADIVLCTSGTSGSSTDVSSLAFDMNGVIPASKMAIDTAALYACKEPTN